MFIKKFIDRVSLMESRRNKDVVITMDDARGLRDEIAKLLIELNEAKNNQGNQVIEVEIKGGNF